VIDECIDRFESRGHAELVRELTFRFPIQVIAEILGIPRADHLTFHQWAMDMINVAANPDAGFKASEALREYFMGVCELRRAEPHADVISDLVHAELDGERLTVQEFGSFFILLVVAGNETTRNAISWGMKLLTDHPDQRQIWWDDFDGVAQTAVEEIVRVASPVISFRRTATAATELGGKAIAEGDKVVMWYNSANRDERVFPHPDRFDVRRETAVQQVGFGAGGPHFCLGANLARREITVMFDELRRRLPQLEITSEPARLQSSFIHGIKRMPCEWSEVRSRS